jgi:hypothetical protein
VYVIVSVLQFIMIYKTFTYIIGKRLLRMFTLKFSLYLMLIDFVFI